MRKAAHWVLLCLALISLQAPAFAGRSAYDWALVRLDHVREEKVSQLRHFVERLHGLANEAVTDEALIQFFDMNLKCSEIDDQSAVPASLREKLSGFRTGFDQYYIERYFAFHDILFIDRDGVVFYSIRKEDDLQRNLTSSGMKDTPLGRCIAKSPEGEAFVDYHQYEPSGEPAAFFVEPMEKEGEHLGWVALQCAANKVNSLFTSSEELGRTGETFLVNEEGFMLTESYFEGTSTILSRKLDDRNIQAKFASGQGHRTVTDYRGITALSSFEVFPFLGTRWLVVAKMDRAEVVTEHYRQHRWFYADRLLDLMREDRLPAPKAAEAHVGGRVLRIDMDEFLKASEGERLETTGVSTCTALLATYPGKFAYLAHVSARDRLYGADQTNLLGQMIKKMKSFDIYPCERRRVTFVMVAPHLNTLLNTVDRLVEEGFLLSQIEVICDPEARAAALSYDCARNALDVFWRRADVIDTRVSSGLGDAWNVGEAMERLMDMEEKEPGMGHSVPMHGDAYPGAQAERRAKL